MMRHVGCCLFVLLLSSGISSVVNAQVEPDSPPKEIPYKTDTWHMSVSPYLWLAGLNGNVTLLGHEAAVHQSFGDILGNLKVGVMALTEVRRGSFGGLADVLYIRVGDQGAIPISQIPATLNLKASANTFLLTPAVAYRVYSDRFFAADVLAGVRYYHLDASIKGSINQVDRIAYSGGNDWVDGIAGARFLVRFTPKAGAFFMGDAGGGGSRPAWQIVTGVGYKVTKRSTLQFGYRRFSFDRQDGTSFGLNTTMEGLILGTTIRLR